MADSPTDTPTAESSERPVDWPLWRRVRYRGGVALGCAAIALVIELLFADIPGGRSLNAYSTRGWSPLWPLVRGLPIGLVAGGVVAGLGLPLFKHRWGGAVVGIMVYLAFLSGFVLGARAGSSSSRAVSGEEFAWWQALALFVGFGVVFAILATQMRSAALGKEEDIGEDTNYWPPL
jgi:hypothetical protein